MNLQIVIVFDELLECKELAAAHALDGGLVQDQLVLAHDTNLLPHIYTCSL